MKSNKLPYVVLQDEFVGDLSDKVVKAIKMGYTPLGGMIPYGKYFYQTMLLPPSESLFEAEKDESDT